MIRSACCVISQSKRSENTGLLLVNGEAVTHMLFSSRKDLSLDTTMYDVDQDLDIFREGLCYLRKLGDAFLSQLAERVELPLDIIA